MLIATLVFVACAALAIVAFCVAMYPSMWLKAWKPSRRFPGYRTPLERQGDKMVGIRLRSAMIGLIFLLAAIVLPIIIISQKYPAKHINDNAAVLADGPAEGNVKKGE